MSDISYALFSTPINERLISELEKRNKTVHRFPVVKTEKIDLDFDDKSHLLNFSKIDWLVFTDVFTVDYFIELLSENEIEMFDLDALRICAFGEAVSDRLRFSEVHADIIATAIKSETVFDQMEQYVGETETKVVLLKRSAAKIEVTDRLRKGKFSVMEISNYREIVSDSMNMSKAKALIAGGAIDEMVFSDPIDIVTLQLMFEGKVLESCLSEIRLSVVNNLMFQMLFEFDFNPMFFEQGSDSVLKKDW